MHLASSSETWPRVSLTTRRSVTGAPPLSLSLCISALREEFTLDFKRDAELVAIAEHGVVGGGQTRGPGVEIVIRLRVAGLARAVGEFHIGAVADAPVAAAGAMPRFKNRARPACFAQLVGRSPGPRCLRQE